MTILQRLILLVTIAVLPAIAIQAYNQLAVRHEREQEVRREALRLAQFAAGELDRILENGRGLLLGISVLPSVREGDVAGCSAAMAELQLLFPQYPVIGAIDRAGHPFCANLPLPAEARWAGPNVDRFRAAEDFEVGFYTRSQLVNVPVLMLGLPFRDRAGAIAGTVFAALDLAWLERYFAGKSFDANATLAVTDRDATVLLRLPDNARYAGTKFGAQYLADVYAKEPGTDEIVGVDGATRILGYVPVDMVPARGLYVGYGITKSVALAALDRATELGLILLVSGMGLALLAAWLGGRYFFSRPIDQLLAAAAAWSRGDFATRARRPRGRSEIARLGRAFNDMAASLQAKQAENAGLLATLEQRVAQRTAELQRATAEREKAEAALHQSQKLESIGQLTGGIAHDFNNLLTAVLNNLELARKRAANAGAAVLNHIDGAMRAAERGATLTQRLLAFGRRQHLIPVALDPAEVLESLHDMLARSIGPQIRLVFEIDPQVWPVSADRNQLELALLNLLLNARDAMPNGGRVTITAANHPGAADSDDFVVLRVADTGTGMAPEVLARAFEPFFTTKELGRGSGLGLSMVYGFALQSGGKLEMRSAPNRGTTVELFLPRAAAGAPSAQVGATPQRAEPFRAPGPGGRVLVCDDDIEVLACMTESLADYGYECVAVTSGHAVMNALAADSGFEAVILDFAMPDMSGIAAAELLRRRHPGLPILLVTGYMESGEIGDGGPKLPTLRKPFMPADLASEIAKLITARRAAAEAAAVS